MRVARVVIAASVATCVVAAGASASKSMTIELRGFGQSVGSSAECPGGLTVIAVAGTHRHALHCVMTVRKLTKPGLDPWRIVESVRVTTPFPGGAIRSVETQTFTFTRSLRSTATFRGRIVGGTGRFEHATGAVSGGGKGRDGAATWRERSNSTKGRLRGNSRTLAQGSASARRRP